VPPEGPPSDERLRRSALVETWPIGTRIARAHPHEFGSAQFDQREDADSRFSTIRYGGRVLPVLYGGQDDAAAMSETIFHTVDVAGSPVRPRTVFVEKYLTWQVSTVATTRELSIVRFDDDGLAALGTSRAELIECDRRSYPCTREWAEAIARAIDDCDGIRWQSRQDPDRWAAVLFGRVARRPGGLRSGDIVGRGPAVPFASQQGMDRLDGVALAFDITVVRP
jgi:hypothetical protein